MEAVAIMPDTDDRPATKGDIEQLRTETNAKTDDLRDQLIERMRDMQTEVIRAFYDWARPMELKLRALPAIEERLGLLEERVSRIERNDKPPLRN
jgi:hypothetical protein